MYKIEKRKWKNRLKSTKKLTKWKHGLKSKNVQKSKNWKNQKIDKITFEKLKIKKKL